MRKKSVLRLVKRISAGVLAGVIFASGVYTNALIVHATEAVTVSSCDAFLTAIAQEKSPIIVNGTFSVANGADSSGKMLPVEIPADTVIRGGEADENGNEPSIDFRCPIQIAGDNVVIENIEIQFTSSTALGSVAHREIFLAGHNLTLDNVSTYLEGADGSLGGIGGSEEECLPTIYAGGFEGTSVGSNASLTIQNANEDTVLQAVYLGHDAGTDSKTSYTGTASVQMGEKVSIRDGIFTDSNSSASIEIVGTGQDASSNNVNNVSFYGNENTTLTVKNATLNKASVNNVENLILDEDAVFELASGSFNNITVTNGACLNLNSVQDVIAAGDFIGGVCDEQNSTDTRGCLVLNKEGFLTVEGTVRGETFLQTDDKNFPGDYLEKMYVSSTGCEEGSVGFVLPNKKAGTYELLYENNSWTVGTKNSDIEVTEIEVVSYPSVVDINTIIGTDFIPAENAPYCEIVWKDAEGNALDSETVDAMMLYYYDKILAVKTAYWENDEASEKTDWANPIEFAVSEDNPGKYYFYVDETYTALSGTYTFILLTESVEPKTVADLKALKDAGLVRAEFEVAFYDSKTEEVPTPDPDPDPEPEYIDIAGDTITVSAIEDQVYTGEAITPAVEIKNGDTVLAVQKDYSLAYDNNINVGSAKITITGVGNYTGTRETMFNIVELAQTPDPDPEPDPDPDPDPEPTPDEEKKEGLWFEIVQEDEKPFYYTGKAIRPTVRVYEGEQELGSKDYKISYSNNKNAGTDAKITVTGKGNYTGKDSIYFTIEKKDIESEDIIAPQEVFAVIRSDGAVKNPKVTIKLGKTALKANTTKAIRDYEIVYPTIPKDEKGRSIAGEYTIMVTGNGTNFTGKREIIYKVIEDTTLQMGKAKISIAKDSPVKKIDYTKPDILPEFVVKIGKTELKKDIDYTIKCPDFVVGKNVITFEPLTTSQYSLYGTKNYTITVTGAPIKHKDILVEGIALEGYDYTGTDIILGEDKDEKAGRCELKVSKVTKRDEAGNVTATEPLAENTDYSLSYKNNIKAGKATVTIIGINGYTGKRTVNFIIKKIDLKTADPDLLNIDIAENAIYNKNGAKAAVSISYNGIPLIEKKDYILTYKNHKKVGENTATVIVKGKGSFTNSITDNYSVVRAADTEVTFTAEDIVKPSSVAKVKPKLTVIETSTKKKLSTKMDYIKDAKYYLDETCMQEITQEDLVVGKELWARIILKGNYGDGETTVMKDSFRLYGTKASSFKLEKMDPQPYTGAPVVLNLEGKVYVYRKINGVKQKVVLEEGTHYKVTYPEGKNIKAGTGKAVLYGMGEYGGTKTISFRISKKSVKFDLGEAILDLFFS